MTNTQDDAASQPGEVALERPVRPVCWRINAMQGTDRPPLWHYVTEPWANFECAPLYDQATLDAAEAAERERSRQAHDIYCRNLERVDAQNERLRTLLARYRNEVPLGHQPHMLAHEVDDALGPNV